MARLTHAQLLSLQRGVDGTDAFHAQVDLLRRELDAKIPNELRLPASILDDLPRNVTGIPATCGLLSPKEVAVTELRDATAVRDAIAAGQLSAVDAVTAFGKRAAIAHQLTGCLVDWFLPAAIKEAATLDEHFQKHGKVVGPLHGVPISMKDHMQVKGTHTSFGFLGTRRFSEDDSDMASSLRKQGAIFYVKTNQPQHPSNKSIMHLESQSWLCRTLNPFNVYLSSGGSTGGESALLAMKGSPLGVGSDIGGSIRNPASCTGIYGFKPTSKILPMKGYLAFQPSWDAIQACTGPMGHSSRDVDLFCSSVLSTQPSTRDPALVPWSWSPLDLKQRKLRVGVLLDDGVVTPHPPIQRVLREAIKKFEASGEVEVIMAKPFKHREGYKLLQKLYFPDGGLAIRKWLGSTGESMAPLTDWVLQPSGGENLDATAIIDLLTQRDAFRQAHSDHWSAEGYDVLLCPPGYSTATPHDTAKYWSYTGIWNLVDYPGYIWPSGATVDPAVDPMWKSFEPLSDLDTTLNAVYDPEALFGAPVCYQLVARRYDDSLLVGAQKVVERILKA